MGIRHGLGLPHPAINYLQLLAFAQGTPYDELGVERQRFKRECLRRYEAGEEAVAGGRRGM